MLRPPNCVAPLFWSKSKHDFMNRCRALVIAVPLRVLFVVVRVHVWITHDRAACPCMCRGLFDCVCVCAAAYARSVPYVDCYVLFMLTCLPFRRSIMQMLHTRAVKWPHRSKQHFVVFHVRAGAVHAISSYICLHARWLQVVDCSICVTETLYRGTTLLLCSTICLVAGHDFDPISWPS